MSRPIRTIRVLSGRQRRSKKARLYAVQQGRCADCGGERDPEELILKHKVHRSKGSGSRVEDLHLICHPCNTRGINVHKH